MIAGGGRRIRRIYVTGPGHEPVTPCGGCRQRLREFADPDVVVIGHGVEGGPLHSTVADLLPHSFGPEFLPEGGAGRNRPPRLALNAAKPAARPQPAGAQDGCPPRHCVDGGHLSLIASRNSAKGGEMSLRVV